MEERSWYWEAAPRRPPRRGHSRPPLSPGSPPSSLVSQRAQPRQPAMEGGRALCEGLWRLLPADDVKLSTTQLCRAGAEPR